MLHETALPDKGLMSGYFYYEIKKVRHMNLINTEKIHPEVAARLAPYLEKMHALHKDDIVSVFLYGSAAGSDYQPKTSDINSCFVVRQLKFQTLKDSLAIVNAGIVKKIAAPLFLTKEYMTSSLDVFPVEFLDMKEKHVLVYGEDVLAGLDIKGEHLRLFCEQQIKGRLIRIRQAYLEVGLKKKGIESLLKESLRSLIPIFRNLIRLKGAVPPTSKDDIIRELCRAFQLDEGVFLPIYKDTVDDEKIAGQDVACFLEKYLAQLENLSCQVDQL